MAVDPPVRTQNVVVVTPEEMRRLLAEHEDSVENRVSRLVNAALNPVKEQAQRIEVQVVKTNGRVTGLERWRIDKEAREAERALATREAAALVATQAQRALEARQWSLGKKTLVGTVAVGAVSIAVSVMTVVLQAIGG